MTERTAPPPGWYQHPGDPTVMRHWDGREWTGHTAPTGTVEPARPMTAGDSDDDLGIFESSDRGLIKLGIVMSILFPIVGVVIGVVLLFKERIGPGLGCILLSVAVIAMLYVLSTR